MPEDRPHEGLVQALSVADNMLLASLRNYFNGFYLVQRKEETAVKTLIKNLAIKVADPKQLITALSGGNEQKVVIAKSMLTSPKILMLTSRAAASTLTLSPRFSRSCRSLPRMASVCCSSPPN